MSNSSGGGKYSFQVLKMASEEKRKLGSWLGIPIFSASKYELENLGDGVFYIIYDDGNIIVNREKDIFYSHGKLYSDGSIHEWDRKVYMKILKKDFPVDEDLQRELDKIEGKTKKEETVEDIDVPDIQLHLMVEDTLKSARMLTIDDLLKGFNYGLV